MEWRSAVPDDNFVGGEYLCKVTGAYNGSIPAATLPSGGFGGGNGGAKAVSSGFGDCGPRAGLLNFLSPVMTMTLLCCTPSMESAISS